MRKTALTLGGFLIATGAALAVSAPAQAAPACGFGCDSIVPIHHSAPYQQGPKVNSDNFAYNEQYGMININMQNNTLIGDDSALGAVLR
ncbi:hypothetical protein [Actinoplanes sp. NPDC049802]|uniref:hypothetical protein n=1 Tax=Actinoplanes sp. NPDC049802 TaxID=3154742 RepID=UPI0033C1BEFF